MYNLFLKKSSELHKLLNFSKLEILNIFIFLAYRKLVCKICGAHGDKAHTLSYCPNNKGPKVVACMNSLKSLRNSTGRRHSKWKNFYNWSQFISNFAHNKKYVYLKFNVIFNHEHKRFFPTQFCLKIFYYKYVLIETKNQRLINLIYDLLDIE